MDGLTVWVNHKSLEAPNVFDVCEAVLKAVQAKHPDASLVLNSVTPRGKHATVIRCATEAVRRLFTDHHVGANFQVDNTTHHLQIQAYRGGENRFFFLSGCKIYPESPTLVARAIESTYGTAEFSPFQCVGRGGIKADCFFVKFDTPPAQLVKKVALEPHSSPNHICLCPPHPSSFWLIATGTAAAEQAMSRRKMEE